MNYVITPDEQGRFRIEFTDDLQNITGLRMSPDCLEPELSEGAWLVLAFAVWDSRDRAAIEVACKLAASLGDVSVAVRPYETVDEFNTWAPVPMPQGLQLSLSESSREPETKIRIESAEDEHPLWLIFIDGEIKGYLIGAKKQEDVSRFVKGMGLSDSK